MDYARAAEGGREHAAALIAEHEATEAKIAALAAQGKTRARARYELRGGAAHVR